MRSRLLIGVVIAVVCVVAGGATVGAAAYRGGAPEQLPEWVTIVGKSYAGLTASEVRARLADWQLSERRREFLLIASPPEKPRKMWVARRGELGAEPDLDAMIEAAFTAADAEGTLDKVSRWFGRKDPVNIAPIWHVDTALTERFLKARVAPVVEKKPVNARLTLDRRSPKIIPDIPGLGLDLQGSVSQLRLVLCDRSAERAELPLVPVAAEVTAEDASGIQEEIASFETHYSERGNRRKNLQLACSLINGTIIKQGGIFSYNEIVGPREADSGFLMAPVIVRGRLKPGMGGGVCQVSSTIYNAALLAGLDVVSRTHHAFPVHYVPPGRDATVVYGSIDLKLRNTTGSAIGIIANGNDSRVHVRIFGKRRPNLKISIERTGVSTWNPRVKTVADSTLPAGKKVVVDSGHAGHRVSVWRVYRQNGRVVKRELVSRDTYTAFPKVVAVGTAPKPAPAGASNPTAGQGARGATEASATDASVERGQDRRTSDPPASTRPLRTPNGG